MWGKAIQNGIILINLKKIKDILLPKHSDWKTIIKKAVEISKEPYDEIFCVLDYDVIVADSTQCEKFFTEVKKLKQKKSTKHIHIKLSMPCIEYWFLLHFLERVSTREFLSYEDLKPVIRNYIDGYQKSEKFFEKCNVYKKLISENKQENARKLAIDLEILRRQSDSKTFPFTEIYSLLDELSTR